MKHGLFIGHSVPLVTNSTPACLVRPTNRSILTRVTQPHTFRHNSTIRKATDFIFLLSFLSQGLNETTFVAFKCESFAIKTSLKDPWLISDNLTFINLVQH